MRVTAIAALGIAMVLALAPLAFGMAAPPVTSSGTASTETISAPVGSGNLLAVASERTCPGKPHLRPPCPRVEATEPLTVLFVAAGFVAARLFRRRP